ncbi:unnamed protein product, partial [Prorocentrum cordatum]
MFAACEEAVPSMFCTIQVVSARGGTSRPAERPPAEAGRAGGGACSPSTFRADLAEAVIARACAAPRAIRAPEGKQLLVRDLSSVGTGIKLPGGEVRRLEKGVDTPLPPDALVVLPMKVKATAGTPGDKLVGIVAATVGEDAPDRPLDAVAEVALVARAVGIPPGHPLTDAPPAAPTPAEAAPAAPPAPGAPRAAKEKKKEKKENRESLAATLTAAVATARADRKRAAQDTAEIPISGAATLDQPAADGWRRRKRMRDAEAPPPRDPREALRDSESAVLEVEAVAGAGQPALVGLMPPGTPPRRAASQARSDAEDTLPPTPE